MPASPGVLASAPGAPARGVLEVDEESDTVTLNRTLPVEQFELER
jgi:hypothetical protein